MSNSDFLQISTSMNSKNLAQLTASRSLFTFGCSAVANFYELKEFLIFKYNDLKLNFKQNYLKDFDQLPAFRSLLLFIVP